MMKWGKICNFIHELKPVLLMVVVQTTFAGVNVFYKLADNDGMNLQVLVAYRFIFSAAFMVPLALFVERKKRPKMTWMVLLQGFGCGLFGGLLSQNLYIKALSLTSATFVSSITNLIPAITFVLAACFRMESVGWKTSHGVAKILGTMVGVGGAMLLTFYKGPELHIWKTNVDILHGQHHRSGGQTSSNKRILGALMAIASGITYSSWLIVQTNLVKTYPCPYSVTALTSVTGAVLSTLFGLSTGRHWIDWKLGWNIRLLAAAYSGMLASGFIFVFVTTCVQMRGPLFTAAFSPLMLVLVAIAGSLLLNESLYLGSVFGALLIIIGLYTVIWGKSKEMKKVTQLCPVGESNGESKRSSFGVSKESSAGNEESKSIDVIVNSSE